MSYRAVEIIEHNDEEKDISFSITVNLTCPEGDFSFDHEFGTERQFGPNTDKAEIEDVSCRKFFTDADGKDQWRFAESPLTNDKLMEKINWDKVEWEKE